MNRHQDFTELYQVCAEHRHLSLLNKVAMTLVGGGALSLALGLFLSTGAGSTEGSVSGPQAGPPMGEAAAPRAPLDPTATVTFTPEPTATPEPPTATPEPPTATPVPPSPNRVPPSATATPRPPDPTARPPDPTARPPATAAPPAPQGSAPAAPPAAAPPAAPASVVMQVMEQDLLNMHNVERGRSGLSALRVDATLMAIARQRAQDMASKNYFAHTSPTGETAFSLMAGYGYPYSIAGENIAKNNYPDAQSAATAMSGFMNSPSHRANILDSRYSYVGVGLAYGADGMKYFAVVFAGR